VPVEVLMQALTLQAAAARVIGDYMRGVRACVLLFVIGWLPAVASAQDKFFTSNGVRIRYVDQGAGEPVDGEFPFLLSAPLKERALL